MDTGSTKNILIIGANGMLGCDAVRIFKDSGYNVIAATRKDFDITDLSQTQNFFKNQNKKIDYVLNFAAYTKVDDAEKEQDLAFLINCKGAENVAFAAKEIGAAIIYISTDYVFDGEKKTPYQTTDRPNPINVYGASKLAGEQATMVENPKHYIVRTSWLYGKNGKNFVDTMLNLAKTNKEIKVVDDQFGSPTYTCDLVDAIKDVIIEKNAAFGIYHFCNSGITNWFEFAKKIFEIAKINVKVTPIPTDNFPRPAKRPKFSAMDNGGVLRSWDEGLKKYLQK